MIIIFEPLLAAGALSSGIFAAQLLIISARTELPLNNLDLQLENLGFASNWS
jgi:hypothetical protein